jgi:hypothetical protein
MKSMGLIYRKTKRVGRNSRLNISKSGVSATTRLGPFTMNSRGRMTIRLGRGLSWRF